MKSVIIIAIIVISASAAGVGVLGYNQYTTDIEDLENQLSKEKYDAEVAAMRASQEKKDSERELFDLNIQKLAEQKKASEKLKQEQDDAVDRLRQQKLEAEQERETLRIQSEIEEAKAIVKTEAKDYPLIQGIVNGGELSFWVEPLPSYASDNVRTNVMNLSSYFDGNWFNGVKLTQTYSKNSADFTINWVKDYQEHYIGRQVGDHLLVGLGSSACKNDWKPFDGVTVYRIMYHEVGHAMGQGHSNNYNNIMYSPTGNQYQYDYKETITLSDGYYIQIYFCNTGKIYFSTEKAYESSASYKVYVLGNDNTAKNVVNGVGKFYPDCSGHKNNWNSFSNTCNVQSGSSLVLFNPSTFGAGADARIEIVISNENDKKDMNFNFESTSRYWSQDQLDGIRDLFQYNQYPD